MFKKILSIALTAFALNACATEPKPVTESCDLPSGKTLSLTTPAQSNTYQAPSCKQKKPVASKANKPNPLADKLKQAEDELAALKAERSSPGVRTEVGATVLAPVKITGVRPVEIIAPESGAAPKERDFNVTVHTKKVRCLFRENGVDTIRTYRDTVQLCHDWANATSLSLGLVDTAIDFDQVTGSVVANGNSAPASTKMAAAQASVENYSSPRAASSDEEVIVCELKYAGKVVDTSKQPISKCKAWTQEQAAKRGWIPAGS